MREKNVHSAVGGVSDSHVVEAREELGADIAVGLLPRRAEHGGDEAGKREQSTRREHVRRAQECAPVLEGPVVPFFPTFIPTCLTNLEEGHRRYCFGRSRLRISSFEEHAGQETSMTSSRRRGCDAADP